MRTFVEALLVPLRSGLTFLPRFNLLVGIVGITTAYAWNPGAPMDDIVVVVTVPVILSYIAARILGAFRQPAARTPTPQPGEQTPSQAGKPPSPEELRRFLFMVRLTSHSMVLIGLSFATLFALPLYLWFEVSWAMSYGLFMAAAMFITGVCTFGFALSQVAPVAWQEVMSVARPAVSRLIPGSVSAR